MFLSFFRKKIAENDKNVESKLKTKGEMIQNTDDLKYTVYGT